MGRLLEKHLPAVVPAHHMNKRHWVSIILDGSMTEEQVFQLIAESLHADPAETGRESTIRISNWQRAGRPSAFILPLHRSASSGLVVISW